MDLENSDDDKSFGSAAKSAAEIKLGFNENCFYGESSNRKPHAASTVTSTAISSILHRNFFVKPSKSESWTQLFLLPLGDRKLFVDNSSPFSIIFFRFW